MHAAAAVRRARKSWETKLRSCSRRQRPCSSSWMTRRPGAHRRVHDACMRMFCSGERGKCARIHARIMCAAALNAFVQHPASWPRATPHPACLPACLSCCTAAAHLPCCARADASERAAADAADRLLQLHAQLAAAQDAQAAAEQAAAGAAVLQVRRRAAAAPAAASAAGGSEQAHCAARNTAFRTPPSLCGVCLTLTRTLTLARTCSLSAAG